MSLVHNDFKFDNAMFADDDPDRVTSILDWYEAFATWKLAVVLQQLFNRFAAADTEDGRLGRLGQHVLPLAEHAHDMLASG